MQPKTSAEDRFFEGEVGTIEFAINCAVGEGAISSHQARQNHREIARLRDTANAWDRLEAACQPGAVDLSPGEKALLGDVLARARAALAQ